MENKLIPQLRFPEFDGEWIKGKFQNLLKINQGLQIAISERYTEQIEGSFFYITNEFLKEGSKKAYYVINPSESVLCNKDDVLMTRTGNTGQVVTNVSGAFHNNFFKIKYDLKLINKDFLVFFLKLHTTQNLILRLAGTSTIPDLNHSDFYRIEISLPSLPEQTSIASFLTAADKRISLLQKKKDKLEEYKKGVMQKIFPSTGSGQNPDIRFSNDDGSAFPDWEEKKLGEVTKYYDGTHQTPKYVKQGVPFYSVEHVTANQFSKTKYITHEVFEKENKRVKLEKDDILMTRIGSIGVAKHINWDVHASFYVSLALIKQNKCFNSAFMSYAFNHYCFQKELWKRTIHVAFPQKINLGEIGECKVNLPSLPEQQKIASFLSSVDKQIENVENQIAKSQKWKQGLLQKMFV